MLYDRWREVARAHAAEQALYDFESGRGWTFHELLKQSDGARDPGEGLVCPRGKGASFIFELLRAWRHGRVVCPLEAADPVPAVETPAMELGPSPGMVHLKKTSATTGAPRYVAFREKQLAADCRNIVATMGLRREWPNIGAISLAHSYGFSNLVLPLLLNGIPLLLLDSALPERLRWVAKGPMAGPFTLAGVPTLWRAWLEAKALEVEIRIGISAGAPLPLKLEEQGWKEFGVRVHNFLGASECGGIAYDSGDKPRTDPNFVGMPMSGVDLGVKDGMLEVRGTAVGESYWPYPEEGLGNGVFQTNDLAEVRDGKLFLFGRANDVINIAGRKVAPDEIERAIAGHPGVKDCLVFEGPRIYDDSQIIAVVVGTANAHQLRKFLEGKVPGWHIPREWHFVESLGHNERGKISRVRWREKLFNSRRA